MVEELGGSFKDFIEPVTNITLAYLKYTANDGIRSSCAAMLPNLVNCCKEAFPEDKQRLSTFGQNFLNELWKAIEEETETGCLIN